LLSDDYSIGVGTPEGLSEAERDGMRQAIPSFKEECDRVSTVGIPESLEHGDLHRGNILVEGNELRLIDWADSVVTHPFCSLGVTLVTIQEGSLDLQAPVAIELRDAYLEGWRHILPLPELQQLFSTCLWIGHVVRALDWDRMLGDAPDEQRKPYQKFVPLWLKRWHTQRDAFRP
jgi:Ser/Thr protein kinase RdoA (MazF antagonist)